VLEVAGIVRLARREGGELGRHRLAHDDGAGAAQRRDAGGVRSGLSPLVRAAAVLGRHIRSIDDVLDADGNPVQRTDALALLA